MIFIHTMQNSMYPKLWEASEISYTELINQLIELAIVRHKNKRTI